MPNTAVDSARQFKDALLKRDAAALGRVVAAYADMMKRLTAEIDAVNMAVESGAAYKARLQRLTVEAQNELTKFQGYLENEIRVDARTSVNQGLIDSIKLLDATVGKVGAGFRGLHPDAVLELLGFLDKNSPLMENMKTLSKWTPERVRDVVTEGVGMGQNPRKIASQIKEAFGGGLTQALRLTRTTQLQSYRAATRANYIANSDVVSGWQWVAALNERTCPACLSLNGKEFPLDETMDEHWNGRCTQIPIIAGFPSGMNTGEEWFNAQPESVQRSILGDAKYEAYSDGKFTFDKLVSGTVDKVWGNMNTVTPLKDLVK